MGKGKLTLNIMGTAGVAAKNHKRVTGLIVGAGNHLPGSVGRFDKILGDANLTLGVAHKT
jgi:hypothetical protein